jgi:hypothetical protein
MKRGAIGIDIGGTKTLMPAGGWWMSGVGFLIPINSKPRQSTVRGIFFMSSLGMICKLQKVAKEKKLVLVAVGVA